MSRNLPDYRMSGELDRSFWTSNFSGITHYHYTKRLKLSPDGALSLSIDIAVAKDNHVALSLSLSLSLNLGCLNCCKCLIAT